ncbi:hypothetical protein KIN20_031417 [Parelaphostrongylus tenuis]|uniref:Uncharacterized protein n=1 Tax=Parelaphostrongylus tenuis TaxID=148309 RepID=A0AAD5R6P1_PARTN|nr:hypothetical protein KIN20_031417 [Parelaphostrongylus tenuis]
MDNGCSQLVKDTVIEFSESTQNISLRTSVATHFKSIFGANKCKWIREGTLANAIPLALAYCGYRE